MYKNKFIEALTFTSSLGCAVQEFTFDSGTLLTEEKSNVMQEMLENNGIYSFKNSAGQCINWCHALQPLVAKAFDCNVLLTIGQLHFGKKTIYNPTEIDFTRWHKLGFRKSDFNENTGFNFHAWLTLPSGEILDLTLWSTLGSIWKKPEMIDSVICGDPDKIAPYPKYTPIIIGNEYIETVESITGCEFLSKSNSITDLSRVHLLMLN
ncbi:MAG: hypothetical protein V4545_04255 [Pseudomonadota bacterium]